jgi:protocatechuate 3,4-dioxygenase alpha subunit
LLRRVATRLYFADEAANAEDPVLALVPAERRKTLLAAPVGEGRYRWDVRLQGPAETVFFTF